MKHKFSLYILGIICCFFFAFTTSSCSSSNPYVKGKGSHEYKHVKTKQARWGSTTSLNSTYKIKQKKYKSSSIKK